MKPSPLLALVVVAAFSACSGGNVTPTAPAQPPNPTSAAPSVSGVAMAVSPNPAVVNERTTVVVSASSPGTVTLDFGDGTQAALGIGNNATSVHIYARSGDFTATVSFTDAAGNTATGSLAVVVR